MIRLEPLDRAPNSGDQPALGRADTAWPQCRRGAFARTRHAMAVLAFTSVFWCVSGISPCSAGSDMLRTGDQFVRHELPSTMYLFGLGVADINDDDRLDIFTTSHQVRPLILVNQPDGRFSNDVLRLNLGTAQDYAGGEPVFDESEPRFDKAGLYVYWHYNALVVHAHGMAKSLPASGTILVNRSEIPETDGPVVIAERPADAAALAGFPGEKPVQYETAMTFRASETSTITIKSFRDYYYAPRFKISEQLPLDAIYIGSERANPVSHDFTLFQSDRHAMAWFDLDGDGATDAVVANGGQGGQIRGRVPEGAGSYEVLLKRAARFEEVFPYRELSSYGCPARQLSTVDYDRDGDLDLYVVCGRGSQQAHQLFQQAADGTFRETAAAAGLAAKGDGLSTWLDADNDGDMDLFWTAQRQAWLYRNNDGHFQAELVGTLRDAARQITMADYDGDGDLDIYLAAPNGSSLLIGKQGAFEIVEPERLGLSADAVCGNWVDYNNDGIQDLHVLPGGLFEQRGDHKFYRTGLLETEESPSSPLCMWFDSNNDGYRDLLVAVPRQRTLLEKLGAGIAQRIGMDRQVWISQNPYLSFLQGVMMGHPFFEPPIWDLSLYRAIGGDRHWLEVGLVGPKGNRPAIGGSVRVRTASATQLQAVGQDEGSSKSSGHYRVYFGLGNEARIDGVQVTWPDGSLQEIGRVASDQLLTVHQEHKD